MNPNLTLPSRTAVLALALAYGGGAAFAADHAEAPTSAADPAADIADLYAWTNDNGELSVVLTYAGLTAAVQDGGTATYDADVLYGIHIDADFDSVADTEIWIRFGQNSAGQWGMQASGIPGTDDVVTGAVGTGLLSSTTALWAGIADDPFFFDLTGFQDTVSTGTLMFSGTDSLAGTNVTAITLQFPYESIVGEDGKLQIWATSGRKGGE
jgi:hypothetical protein